MVRVLHLSADFPDPVARDKTPAIQRLIDLTTDRVLHRVISLNRVSPGPGKWIAGFGKPRLAIEARAFPHGEALAYRAPGHGLWHSTLLLDLGDALADRVRDQGAAFDLVVGHKLTIEGIVAARMAHRLKVPYALSVQGNTDARILRARPDLHSQLRRVWHDAAVAFPFTPWALDAVSHALGAREHPTVLLPCVTAEAPIQAPSAAGNGMLSVFHLRHWRTKGFDRLLHAYRLLAAAGSAQRLTVVGGGDPATLARCRELAADVPGVEFAGAMSPGAVAARMNAATAFVMPSRRESFGMVFIEALRAGLPVIYPAGQAVAGYFDDCPFAIPVDAGSPPAIAAAMAYATAHEGELKAALADWQQGPGPEFFGQAAIADRFADGLIGAAGKAPL